MTDNFLCEELSKDFAGKRALHKISLTIQAKERILLLGTNGSGKSTLLKVFAGLLTATTGTCSRPSDFAYFGQDLHVYSALTVEENLNFFYSVRRNTRSGLLDDWGLHNHRDQFPSTLSQGLQQRLSLACFFLKDSKFLLLDEPSTFLDNEGIHLLQRRIEEHAGGMVIASHAPNVFARTSSRVLALKKGVMALDSSTLQGGTEAALRCYEDGATTP